MQPESTASSPPTGISMLEAARTGAVPRPQWPPPAPITTYERPKYSVFKSITIKKFSFQKVPEKTALFYDIEVATGDSTYMITRRFAYLKILHEWVCTNIPGLQLKTLPAKIGTFFGSREAEAKKRQAALQLFFDQICNTKWFSNLVFIRKFLANSPEVHLDVPEYPDSGLVYIHVVESKGLGAFGPNRLKIMPSLSFGKGSSTSAFVTKQTDPSHAETKIYQEVVHSVARRSLQSLLILVVDTHPAERPRGPFSEIDLAQLAPFQMYEIEEIFKVKMDPPPSVKLMLQWVPMTFEKPIKLILPSARLHFHNSTVAPGDVLRGEFILCNDIPRPCTGVTLHLRCRQSADYQEIKEIKRHKGSPAYKSVRHTASVELAHASRCLIPLHEPLKAGSNAPILPSGFYVWPFEFAIPVDSPASFQVPESIMVQNKNTGTFWSLDAQVGLPHFPQPTAPVKVLQVLGVEDERRIIQEEMSTLGEELLLNGIGFRIVSRDGWIWNHGELRNISVGLRAAQVKEIHSAFVRLQGHAMVYANQPRLKKKTKQPLADSRLTGSDDMSKGLDEIEEFEEDAQYGVSDAINKAIGEFNFEQRVVQGKATEFEVVVSISDDIPTTFFRSLASPLLACNLSVWVDVTFTSMAGKREATSFPIPIYVSAKPAKTLLYPVPPAGVSETVIKGSGFGLPHMPFDHFHKYPTQPSLGRTPLMPPYSWFYPLTLEPNYPLSPTNLVTLPSSTFHHARVLAPELPTLEVLIERLRALAPTDGAVKDLLDEVEQMSKELAMSEPQTDAAQTYSQLASDSNVAPQSGFQALESTETSIAASPIKAAVPAALLRIRGETLLDRAELRHRGESIAAASLRSATDYMVVPGDSSTVKPRDRTSADLLRRTLSKQSLASSASSSEIILETREKKLQPSIQQPDKVNTGSTSPRDESPAPVPSRLSIMVTEALREPSPSRLERGRGSVKTALAPQGPRFSMAQRILLAAQGRSSRESIRRTIFIETQPQSTESPKTEASPVGAASSSLNDGDPAPF